MLDIDHGDYPFVTSSSPTSGGALTGLGFGPLYVDRVVGVTKCASARASAPVRCRLALSGALGDRLRGTGEHFWDEYGGIDDGRPRRCGWLDTVMLRYAAEVSGFTDMVMTKLDVLSGFETLQIATSYDLDGAVIDYLPVTTAEQNRVKPVYETVAGWSEDIGGRGAGAICRMRHASISTGSRRCAARRSIPSAWDRNAINCASPLTQTRRHE
ncbi:MAG: adenylosuccinate synthetase [Anaerolineae bacterium]